MGSKYRRVRVAGRGSFGCCWLVENDRAEQCVLKEIDISRMPEKQRLEAVNEVKVLSKLRHPFIINYRESYVENGLLCIVTDFAEQGDLYSIIHRQKSLGAFFAESLVLQWFMQIALALKHMHDRRVLHRDLKTQNIFVSGPGLGCMKVGDFGIARVLQHTQDLARTAIGTPFYLSPEICQEKPYSFKSDIWSLGCVLFELATLRHAFDSDSMRGLVLKILRGVPPQLPTNFSAELRALVSDMLTKDPMFRPTIDQVLRRPAVRAQMERVKQELELRSAGRAHVQPPVAAGSNNGAGSAPAAAPIGIAGGIAPTLPCRSTPEPSTPPAPATPQGGIRQSEGVRWSRPTMPCSAVGRAVGSDKPQSNEGHEISQGGRPERLHDPGLPPRLPGVPWEVDAAANEETYGKRPPSAPEFGTEIKGLAVQKLPMPMGLLNVRTSQEDEVSPQCKDPQHHSVPAVNQAHCNDENKKPSTSPRQGGLSSRQPHAQVPPQQASSPCRRSSSPQQQQPSISPRQQRSSIAGQQRDISPRQQSKGAPPLSQQQTGSPRQQHAASPRVGHAKANSPRQQQVNSPRQQQGDSPRQQAVNSPRHQATSSPRQQSASGLRHQPTISPRQCNGHKAPQQTNSPRGHQQQPIRASGIWRRQHPQQNRSSQPEEPHSQGCGALRQDGTPASEPPQQLAPPPYVADQTGSGAGRTDNLSTEEQSPASAVVVAEEPARLLATLEEGLHLGKLGAMLGADETAEKHKQKHPDSTALEPNPLRFLRPDGQPLELPMVHDGDSMCFRIEALRIYLEQEIGLENFLKAYWYLNETSSESVEGAKASRLEELLVSDKTLEFLPLLHQLIFCEDQYFGAVGNAEQ